MSVDIQNNNYNDSDEKLCIKQFEINENEKTNQELFHYVLQILIERYNALGHEKSKEEGIYYLKDKLLLSSNITEEYIQGYKQYKELFIDLMTKSGNYYPKYDPEKPKKKTISSKNGYDNRWEIQSNYSNNSSKNQSSKNGKYMQNFKTYYESRMNKEKEVIYNLNHFCSYFNGMFFESLVAETFFSLIDKDYDSKSNQKKVTLFFTANNIL